MARIVPINKPGVAPAAFFIRRMIFADSPPVQTMPGNFLSQYPFAPGSIYRWIKQRSGRDAVAIHPPGIYLHLAHVKTFAGRLSLPDDRFGFRPRGREVRLARHVDSQRIQSGFLLGDGLHQTRRRAGSLRYGGEGQQTYNKNGQSNSFHGAASSCVFALSRANKLAPQGRT